MIRILLLLIPAAILVGCGGSGSEALPIPADAAVVVRADMAELNKQVSQAQLLELASTMMGDLDVTDELAKNARFKHLFLSFWQGKELKGLNFKRWYAFVHNPSMPDNMLCMVVQVEDAKAVRKDLVKSLELPAKMKFEEEDDLWIMNLTEGNGKIAWVVMSNHYLVLALNLPTQEGKKADAQLLKSRLKTWLTQDEDDGVQKHEAFQAMQQRKGFLVSYISYGAMVAGLTASQPMAAMMISRLPFTDLYNVIEVTSQPGRLLVRYDFYPTEATKTLLSMFVEPKQAHSGYLPAHSTVFGAGLNLHLANLRAWTEDQIDRQGGFFKQGYEEFRPNLEKFEKIFSGRFYFGVLDMAISPGRTMLFVLEAELNKKGALSREIVPWLDKLGLKAEEVESNTYKVLVSGTDYYLTEENGLLLISNHTDIRSRLARYNPESDKTLAEQKQLSRYSAYYYLNLNHKYLPRGLREAGEGDREYAAILELIKGQRMAGYITSSGAQYYDLTFQQKDKNGLLMALEALVTLKTEQDKSRKAIRKDEMAEEPVSVQGSPL